MKNTIISKAGSYIDEHKMITYRPTAQLRVEEILKEKFTGGLQIRNIRNTQLAS